MPHKIVPTRPLKTRNPVARALRDPRFQSRVVPDKRRECDQPAIEEDDNEDDEEIEPCRDRDDLHDRTPN